MPEMVFQQGVNGYSSTSDTMLSEAKPNQKYGSATNLSADSEDGGGASQVLLRFDNLFGLEAGRIPTGAHITEASLTLQTTNAGAGAVLHQMLSSWNENDTWRSLDGGIQANGTEAAAAADLEIGRQSSLGPNTFDVTRSLQAWAGGADNYGWAFLSSHPDGWDFSSSESGFAPILTIKYTLDTPPPDDTNVAPVATDDTAATDQNVPVTIAVLSNDSDADEGSLSVSDITDPSQGAAIINPNGSITYTPDPGFLGDDSFSYTVSDGQGGTDNANVVINVSAVTLPPPPAETYDALNDTATTSKGQATVIDVLANDLDQGGDDVFPNEVTVAVNTSPSHGTAVVNADDTFTYTPNAGFIGTDSFTYALKGPANTDTATVSITVSDVSQPPPPPPAGTPFTGTVTSKVETPSVTSGDDKADDTAIWVNKADPSKSVVYGTDKGAGGGLYVYDLDGHVIQHIADQPYNNVDMRYGVNVGGQTRDVVGVSNVARDTMDFFVVGSDGKLTAIGDAPSGISIYGFAMGETAGDGKLYAFATTETGTLRQYQLDASSGTMKATVVRTVEVGSQSEGLVVDDQTGSVYVAEENVGIWQYKLDPATGSTRTQIDAVGTGGHIPKADVEGLAIWYAQDGNGYLVASSQGSHAFNVYNQRGSNEYLGTFKIGDGNGIDSVQETDGFDLTSAGLGSLFPNGMVAVHDHSNDGGSTSNYKFVDWGQVAQLGNLKTNPAIAIWDIL